MPVKLTRLCLPPAVSVITAGICFGTAFFLVMARYKFMSLCIGTFSVHDVSLCVGEKGISGAVIVAIAALALGDREPGSVSTKEAVAAGFPRDPYAALTGYVQAYARVVRRANKLAASRGGADAAAGAAGDGAAGDGAAKLPDSALALIDAASKALPIDKSPQRPPTRK